MDAYLTPPIIYGLTGITLFAIGLTGLIGRNHPLHIIMAANIIAGGVFFFFLVTVGYGDGKVIDPVPHAMVLTGIVVSVSCTGLGLALSRRIMENASSYKNRDDSGEKAR